MRQSIVFGLILVAFLIIRMCQDEPVRVERPNFQKKATLTAVLEPDVTITGETHFDMHRPVEEHFKLVDTETGDVIPLNLELNNSEFVFKQLWRGFTIKFYNDTTPAENDVSKSFISFYSKSYMEEGKEYLLSWVVWEVGRKDAIEKTVKFKISPKGP